ncbi:MAG: cupin domain-containing protein [Dinoroseobacter sp.]|nr:cupin domain-containing protein [Dinoroseobacter sp.]MDJ0993361.1 cupin domain-containing protein [Dinoroseobacter sp.]
MERKLDGGVTRKGESSDGVTLNILGQKYYVKAFCESTFAFETNSAPGDHVPVHVHTTQDEFILVQEGVLDLKLDGQWTKAFPGDVVRMPKGVPHGYFNKSESHCRALFWVSPAGKLKELFDELHEMTDVEAVIRVSAEHDVEFLPPEANE